LSEIVDGIFAACNACAKYEQEPQGRDRWQTPAELKASGAGDCEDFAIAYWRHLKDAGLPARLAWCFRKDDRRRSHMVCLCMDDDPWVLDVAVDAVCRLSERPDLEVIMELDTDGVHVGGAVKPVQLIPEWAGVLERMEATWT